MKHPGRPTISVGVPVFNGGRGIERCLRSILAQSYEQLEVVISDNASTDHTREICAGICAGDHRVRYARQPRNIGQSRNFKLVLDRARGDYFMWLGHDDWLSTGYLDACLRALTESPGVSLACGEAVYFRDEEEVHRGVVVQLLQESSYDRVVTYFGAVADNGTFYGLMRRRDLLESRLQNVMGGDWLLLASIAFRGKVVTLPRVRVNRALGGSTVSYERIARNLGLPKIQALFPHVTIALAAFLEIAWRDPVYSISRGRRIRLAWQCQKIIRHRHGSSALGILRSCFGYWKQHCWKSTRSADGSVGRERDT